jgi:hypothetical protein
VSRPQVEIHGERGVTLAYEPLSQVTGGPVPARSMQGPAAESAAGPRVQLGEWTVPSSQSRVAPRMYQFEPPDEVLPVKRCSMEPSNGVAEALPP